MNCAAYFKYWGKARPKALSTAAYHLLPYHCLDVAAVGREYLRRSNALRGFFRQRLHADDDDSLLDWFAFWLVLHDLGKFAEAFQSQRPDLFLQLRGREPAWSKVYTERHDSLGMKFWQDNLAEYAAARAWFGPNGLDYDEGVEVWVRTVTGHHGQPPKQVPSLDRFFDMQEDQAAIRAFTENVRELLLSPAAARLPELHEPETFRRLSVELSWWIAGVAVLADWVGSNADVFVYRAEPTESLAEYWRGIQAPAAQALQDCGVLPSRRQHALAFGALFPAIAQPSPLQAWAASAALPDGPQIHMLEDVTGAGKTEAAVMLAHRLIAAGHADGFFIGLPTMATANAMYSRIAGVYAQMFAGDASLVLAHGHKTLVEKFATSVLRPGPEEIDARQQDESATARCTAWLADHNKRALLAPAGVGTIDQVLLAALQSKHQSLRLLGLFRKVLVVDEVHACDAYMQGVLETLLRMHARAGGSAVLLSATLTRRMKRALLKAFAHGSDQAAPSLVSDVYPLVTSWSATQPAIVTETPTATRADVRRRIAVRYECDRVRIVARIVEALNAGRCVAWIRNTIGDALDARAQLAQLVSPECITLFHARFALGDRLAIEEAVLRHFGRDSGPEDRGGRLLIATQVAEQSLDVDFDLVVSDLAPIDRLIQRAGRLCRHVRDGCGRRLHEPGAIDERGEPCLWVFGPEWSDTPSKTWFKAFLPKSASVYPHHAQLWFTARVLRNGYIDMPDDARRLIESVFGDVDEPPEGLRGNASKAEGRDYGDASLAQLNSIKLDWGYERRGNEWMSDAVAPSRLGEDTVEVLIGRWNGDRLEPWFEHEVERHAWAYSAVRVPMRLIAEAAVPTDLALRVALETAKERLPGAGKWRLLLPFAIVDGGQWRASAVGSDDHRGQRGYRTWSYDRKLGLTSVHAPEEP